MSTELPDMEPVDVEWDQYLKVFCPKLAPFYLSESGMNTINRKVSLRNAQY